MQKRINHELNSIIKEPINNIQFISLDNNISLFYLIGPSDTPYQNAKFKIKIEFNNDYPYSPPTVTFMTKIYHPNINSMGQICLDILKDQWSPILTLSKILLSISSLLAEPNADDPLEPAIADLMNNNYDMYLNNVKEYIEKYSEIH